MPKQQFILFFSHLMSLLSNQSRISKEAQIYDDLSQFIQIFKRTITLVEQTALNIQKGIDYLPPIEKIKTHCDQMEAISLKYKSDNASLPIQEMYQCHQISTFHRFICRITQMIALPKAKYQSTGNSHSINCFTTCLREIERVVKKYQEEKLFCRIVELTQIIFIKFCITCENNNKITASTQAVTLQTSDSLKKMNERVTNFRQQEKNSKQKSCLELNYTKSQKQLQRQQKPKLATISQTLSDIQKRYDTFKGMDVDYSYFKTSYFEAKSSYDSFYKEYLQRNTQLSKIITYYADDYQLLKKRNQKIYQRNKRLKTNEQPNPFREQSHQNLLKNQHYDRQIRMKKSKANQTCDEAQIKQKIAPKNDFNNNKVEYQMKNVYITLSRKNMQRHRQNRLSPSMIKRRILQTQSSNQSFINEKIQKTSTFHNEKKPLQSKNEQKQEFIKVQFDKFQMAYPKNSKSNNQIIPNNISNNMHAFAKPVFKSKYLQINCITKKKDTNSKSQLSLSRAPHKYVVTIEERQKFIAAKPI